MKFEKRLKKHIISTLDEHAPNPYKKKKIPLWVKLMLPVAALAVTILIPIAVFNTNNIENIMSQIYGAFVDMKGVAGFGVGNIPEDGGKPHVKSMKLLSKPLLNDIQDNQEDNEEEEDNETYTSDSEMELYEWELDYDWDPDKASVLFTLSEEGGIKEVVYERTNGKGVVRQDKLCNAATIYVSKSFTYVMYVNDREWNFWRDINFAQELCSPSGFHVHHESMQTIVINNETGEVFPLKELQTIVSDYSGAKNYTMQAMATKDDFLAVTPMYGMMTPLWFKVNYDKENGISYENVLSDDCGYGRTYQVKVDIYGQMYVLADADERDQTYRIGSDFTYVQLSKYKIIDNKIFTQNTNSILFGNDCRAYAVVNNKLQVFGENFTLSPVEKDTVVNLEGLANEFFENDTGWLNGACYHYEGGYFYSAFGQAWEVGEDGELTNLEYLNGNFVQFTNDAFMIGGEIIGFVNTTQYLHYSVDGEVVRMVFYFDNGVPNYRYEHLMYATELHNFGHRVVALQDKNGGYGFNRGPTKYYLLTAKSGVVAPQYIAYGDNGGVQGSAGCITEPLDLTE